jgi:protein-S-isoprenylcysteine O-methyltransferase Ste14
VLSGEHIGFPPGILISIVLLVLFSLYWKSPPKTQRTPRRNNRAPRAAFISLWSLRRSFCSAFRSPAFARFLPNATALIGLVIEAAFFLQAVWARQLLGRNWSGAVAIKVDQALIRSGPYNFVRHPIYSGMLGAYLGSRSSPERFTLF